MTSHGNARIVKVPVDPADKIQFVGKSSLSSNKSIFLWNLLMESLVWSGLVWIFVCGRLCSFLDEGVVVKMSQKHFYGRLVFHILVPNQIQSIRNIFPNQIIDLISREFRAAFKRILCKFFCQTKWKKRLIFWNLTQIKWKKPPHLLKFDPDQVWWWKSWCVKLSKTCGASSEYDKIVGQIGHRCFITSKQLPECAIFHFCQMCHVCIFAFF